jgi:uncharacterized membrane protein HdeD (DUF308 family)
MSKEMISNRQFMILIALIIVATSSLYVPQAVTYTTGRDGWYVVMVAGVVGAVNCMVFLWLERMYPGKSFLEINKLLLGDMLGRF